jgi:carboxyl-terminal processing protease
MKTLSRFRILILILFFTALSCKKEEESEVEIVNQYVFELMKDVYLWYDHLPATINPSAYPTPDSLMKKLRYPVYDRWSSIISKTEFNQYYLEGTMIGHGILLGLDENENVRIAFVYRSTQAYDLGVRRSWIVSKVNGTSVTPTNIFDLLGDSEIGITNNIEFINENAEYITLSLTKDVINITPVLHYEVLLQGDTRIGYIVFQDFIDAATEELDEAFTSFNSEGVDEMIVDLRYNGGGSVDIAEYLAGWLIGRNYGNQPFINFRHNDKNTRNDTTVNVPVNTSGPNLDRIFFIGTSSTASASELIINGVKPFVTTTLAGTPTHGKPVGMDVYAFRDYDYVVLPITFKYTNKDNVGDFYDGLIPDIYAEDDLTKNFGNPEESSLKSVLDYIETGLIPEKELKTTAGRSNILELNKPINQYLKAY